MQWLVCCFDRADAVTDLDEGADPSDPTQGSAEGAAPTDPATATHGPDQNGAAEAEEASSFAQRDGEAADAYARRIFERVFGHDIERVLSMEVLPVWITCLGAPCACCA